MLANAVDLACAIPNNVGLEDDPKVMRALLRWQPQFLDWWREMGPTGFSEHEVYLRTAVDVTPEGWARYDYCKMPDYRWGIFLSPKQRDGLVRCGDQAGEKAWDKVPGEYRNALRNIIVTQGDTEPASVEQQRRLGLTAPSLYDLRNLFQVNVEEARHLWAMAYLLQKHFGREGRDDAETLLARRSGDVDQPRMLEAFNRPCDDWLSFFCYTMFTDRDGKFQLAALRESAFDPLARSTEFMLTEEAFHLFVGEKGIARIIRRSAELEALDPNGDVEARGGIAFETIQRAINYWFSYCLDLFGSEDSSNAATYFSQGLKGRFKEASRHDDHQALEGEYLLAVVDNGRLTTRRVPLRRAMNELLRDEYIKDCQRAMDKWNRLLETCGSKQRLRLPSRRFHRHHGEYARHHFAPNGELIDRATWEANLERWLPNAHDRAHLAAIMQPVTEPGKFANWIAAPARGMNGQPIEFEYVRV